MQTQQKEINFKDFFEGKEPTEIKTEESKPVNNSESKNDFRDVTGNTGIDETFSINENSFSPHDDFEFKEPKQNSARQEKTESLNIGSLFPVDMVVEVADKVFSTIGALIVSKVAKKKVSAKSMQATAAEKKTIEPPLENYLKSVNFKLTPLNALLLTIGAIYGMKGVEIANGVKGQNTAPKESTETAEQPRRNPGVATGRPVKNPNSYYNRKKRGEA